MKKNNKFLIKITGILTMAFLLLSSGWFSLSAQSIVPFNPRASTPAGSTGQYNIKGDFQMVGNSNLVASVDPNGTSTSQSNATDMIYVNVDPQSGIVNSSTAALQFPSIAGVNPNCTEIVYAGLYWSGRADNGGTASNTFSVATSGTSAINTNVTNGNSSNGYTVGITSADYDAGTGTNNGRLATYTFTPGSGDVVVFKFYTWRTTNNNNSTTQNVTVQVGTGAVTTLAVTQTNNSGDNYAVSLNTPYVLPQGNGLVTNLRKRRTDNSINNNYYATVQTPAVAGTAANLDKTKVKFKFAGDTYQDITAATGPAINYPPTNYGQMFAGYADVTNYVKSKGLGNYTVANIALREGDGGSTGYYGSWGLVVVYKNPAMTDKSITVFDGYGYMASGGGTQTLNVSGFSTPPTGNINASIGMMAGEGDVSISGDTFSIRQGTSTNYRYLDHSGNTSTSTSGAYNNFFDSSITIAGNPPRTPNHTNNYGSDIHMMNLVNTTNSIIGNSQTSTSFQYSSSQDTYIIYSIVFSVDNYVPNPTSTISNTSIVSGATLSPGDTYSTDFNITNPGNEAVTNTVFSIPIPYNQIYVSSNVTYWDSSLGAQVNPVFTGTPGQPGGTLTWNLGTLPLQTAANKNKILASLHVNFKITEDCLLLTGPVCKGTSEQSSFISGTGQQSDQDVNQPTITGTSSGGGCTAPTTDPFSFNLDISSVSGCPSNLQTDPNDPSQSVMVYNATGNTVPRATIVNDFPAGTIFYSVSPTDPTFTPTTNVITGDFPAPVNGSDPAINYYAVVPNMPTDCYIHILVIGGRCLQDPNTTGSGLDTKAGITLLKRAGNTDTDNWPMVRKGGYIALESNTKGFVVTRMATASLGNITNPVEGMMVYDTTAKCLKIYADGAWKCFSNPGCP